MSTIRTRITRPFAQHRLHAAYQRRAAVRTARRQPEHTGAAHFVPPVLLSTR